MIVNIETYDRKVLVKHFPLQDKDLVFSDP